MKNEEKDIRQLVVDACAEIIPVVIKTLDEIMNENQLNGEESFNFLMSIMGSIKATILSGVSPQGARDHMALLSAVNILTEHHSQVTNWKRIDVEELTPTPKDVFQ